MSSFQLFLPWAAKLGFPRPEKSQKPALPISESPDTEPWKHGIAVRVIRHPRARRYLLRLEPDGTARLVIPRRGSRREAWQFLERSEAWLLRRYRDWQTRQTAQQPWRDGKTFLFRGEPMVLRVEEAGDKAQLHFAGHVVSTAPAADYRRPIHAWLRRLAERELPPRTRELAGQHGISITRVTVRAQKTRWGSCSTRGTISLNWRLVQAPEFVRDYLIVHELMHRRQMNHSARYWRLVAAAFPDYRAAERWLKQTRLSEFD